MLNDWLDIGLGKVTAFRHDSLNSCLWFADYSICGSKSGLNGVQKWNGFPITALEMPEVVEKQEEIHPDQLPHHGLIINGDQISSRLDLYERRQGRWNMIFPENSSLCSES